MSLIRRPSGTLTVSERTPVRVEIPSWMRRMTLAELVLEPKDGKYRYALSQVKRLRHGTSPRSSMRAIRQTAEDRRWAEAVKTRDGYACRRCIRSQAQGFQIQAAHIVPRGKRYPRTTLLVENGLAMCVDCHLGWAHDGNLREFVRWAAAQVGPEIVAKLQVLSPTWKGWRHVI